MKSVKMFQSLFTGYTKYVTSLLVVLISIVAWYTYTTDYFDSGGNNNVKMSEDWKNAASVYEFKVKTIEGEEISLEKYRGHVLLIVNVASKCGLTPTNYQELVELDEKYRDSKGLRILAFPCNQFARQEPGTNEEIVCFMKKKNAVFDTFEKINVNGGDAHPLWKYLKHKQGGLLGSGIKWNFTKFIINKEGQPVERHGPNVNPSDLVQHLEKYW